MNAETVKAVQEALAPVAQKLGEGASHLYEIYTRQMVAEAIAGAILCLFFIIVLSLFWPVWYRKRKNYLEEHRYSSDLSDGIGIVGGIFSSILMVVIIPLTMYETTTKLINPEYYAIERILDQVTGRSK